MARGKARLQSGQAESALQDFDAALTYPANLGVGRTNRPEEAAAQYYRGQALQALNRPAEAQSAYQAGAAGTEGGQEQNEYRKLCREAVGGSR
jgi:tetratricopeptide (TPR) repeat protein